MVSWKIFQFTLYFHSSETSLWEHRQMLMHPISFLSYMFSFSFFYLITEILTVIWLIRKIFELLLCCMAHGYVTNMCSSSLPVCITIAVYFSWKILTFIECFFFFWITFIECKRHKYVTYQKEKESKRYKIVTLYFNIIW